MRIDEPHHRRRTFGKKLKKVLREVEEVEEKVLRGVEEVEEKVIVLLVRWCLGEREGGG
jgi:hypothetical protein